MGADLVNEAQMDSNSEIRLSNLIEFIRAQTLCFGILKFLTSHFDKVEILEHCGEFFKMRVPKEDKTIGWLFGKLEAAKRDLSIQEYSVSQTTLEQIFQNFANQSIASDKAAFTFHSSGDKLILENPDHQMTEEQERFSERGLSFHEERPDKGDDNDNGEGLLLRGDNERDNN